MTNDTLPGRSSQPELLVLHSVRIQGMADEDAVAGRFGLDTAGTREILLDDEAYGWVSHAVFTGTSGWSMTERGRTEDDRRLAEELQQAGARSTVESVHERFGPLNARLLQACTDWQLRADGDERLVPNAHTDPEWDARVLDELETLEAELEPLVAELSQALERFEGYDRRFSSALARARAGQGEWVAGTGVASCHAVWMELHEDLISTLGIDRAATAGQ
ncbi:transcriptional regulator [Promicromonospora sp. NPDC052451]|uniref:transcriptional regulator n=1 Tax=Promicromonospora sp. NPDC052451 TaxID=3364407 RepID=UPI0037CC37E2